MREIPAATERGAAVVEMAFVTILLFLLMAGIVDVGRAIYTNIGLQDAAQEGAMFASYHWPTSESDIAARIVDTTDYPALEESNVEIGCEGARAVRVKVSHSVDLFTPVVGQFLGGSIDLSQEFVGEIFTEASCT